MSSRQEDGKHTIHNVESDFDANINTDHYPVVATIRIKLKAVPSATQRRKKYRECTPQEKEQLNNGMRQAITNTTLFETRSILAETAKNNQPTLRGKIKHETISPQTLNLLEQRGQAIKANNTAECMKLEKQFRKSRRQDKKEQVLQSLSKDLDIRDKWMGIRHLRQNYQPQPYHAQRQSGENYTNAQASRSSSSISGRRTLGKHRKANGAPLN